MQRIAKLQPPRLAEVSFPNYLIIFKFTVLTLCVLGSDAPRGVQVPMMIVATVVGISAAFILGL